MDRIYGCGRRISRSGIELFEVCPEPDGLVVSRDPTRIKEYTQFFYGDHYGKAVDLTPLVLEGIINEEDLFFLEDN